MASTSPFFSRVPRAALVQFFAAVFCIFAPMMMLSTTVPAHKSTGAAVAFWFTLSGAIAILWALAFTYRIKLLWLVIPMQILLVILFASRALPGVSVGGAGVSFVGLGSVLMLVLGYIFFVRFISSEGARTFRLQTEMELAQKIHEGLVPSINSTDGKIQIVGRSEASSEMGGDLLDVHIGEESTDVLLADVSGHGVRAGVLMAMIKSAIRTRLLSPCSLSQITDDLNKIVSELAEPGMFATFAALRFHKSGTVEYCVAGHLPILHWKSRDGSLEELTTDGFPLGVVADARFQSATTRLAENDRFLLYTDGLTEIFDEKERQLGMGGFKNLTKQHAQKSPDKTISSLFAAARAHGPNNNTGEQEDDQTLIVIGVLPQ